jgi:hypothetical protein
MLVFVRFSAAVPGSCTWVISRPAHSVFLSLFGDNIHVCFAVVTLCKRRDRLVQYANFR